MTPVIITYRDVSIAFRLGFASGDDQKHELGVEFIVIWYSKQTFTQSKF